MNKIVNGVANDYEFPNLYDPNISYSKAYTEQLLAEKDKEIERLNNIIKKVVEYIPAFRTIIQSHEPGLTCLKVLEDILKGGNNERKRIK